MVRVLGFSLIVVAVTSCGVFVNDGPWDLELGTGVAGQSVPGDIVAVFPNQASLDNTSFLRVWAFDPAGLRCEDFISGDITTENIESFGSLQLKLPLAEGAMLKNMPDQKMMFFVQARDENVTLLRGCVVSRSRKGLHIEIFMECVCQPIPGICAAQQEIAGNSIDDDCDGMTDECLSGKDCDDGNSCTSDSCIDGKCSFSVLGDGVDCKQGDKCVQSSKCKNGVCVTGNARDCSSYSQQDSCLLGVCDPITGECKAVKAPDGTHCDDQRYCTVNDSCKDGKCEGQPRDCSDGDICTYDKCDEDADKCSNPLHQIPGAEGPKDDPSCSDGLDNDCDGFTDLADGNCKNCDADVQCDDGNPCTKDECGGNRECINTLREDNFPCDDGIYCNGPDFCLEGVCAGHAGNPCTGADFDGDCAESCDESQNNCKADDPDNSPCDDGLWCTVNDACHGGSCHGVARDCFDGDRCTDDVCNESSQMCDFPQTSDTQPEGPVGDATCGNGIDEDCDGLTDYDDFDCHDCSASSEAPDLCSNQIDDDCDGVSDSNDPDCGCVSNCTDKVCGDDGCGGVCGPGCSDGLDCVHGRCMALNWTTILGGTYMMGVEDAEGDDCTSFFIFPDSPPHEVTVPSFQLTRTEITAGQYQLCYDAGMCTAPEVGDTYNKCVWGRSDEYANNPINCVSWNQAVAFCEWIGGRLPSDSEWEFAARSRGADNIYPWGEDDPNCDFANFGSGSGSGCNSYIPGQDWVFVKPVCSCVQGNTQQGLCDMAGNVAEYVQDSYHSSYCPEEEVGYVPPTDGSAWIGGPQTRLTKIIRGGDYYSRDDISDENDLMCTRRDHFMIYDTIDHEDTHSSRIGFRCAR